jgi:hypothetical protein
VLTPIRIRVQQTLDPLSISPGPPAGFSKSAASWSAIIAGAFVAASASLILLALGGGLGFAAISPWPGRGVSAATFTIATAIWLIVTQWVSAALGGYMAGRLRTRWIGTHTHEVFFRDTAHGLVTWSVATVLVAAVAANSASSLISGGMRAGANAASTGAQTAAAGSALAGPQSAGAQGAGAQGLSASAPSAALTYDIDRLFRPSASSATDTPSGAENGGEARLETLYIAYNAIAAGGVPDADRSYLAALVSAQAGIPRPEAQQRVDEFFTAIADADTKARAAADTARKAAAEASIYTALSLLIGAFIACVSAVLGGRLRDEHP